MRTLGIITARGGSKRLPNKNMADLGGKPLIAWTIEVALATCIRTVVTTDDREIESLASKLGADVIRRPAQLAQDDTPSLPVVVHAVEMVCRTSAVLDPLRTQNFGVVALFQPTSPFRTVEDVKGAMTMFEARQADAVVSVSPFDKQDTLFSLSDVERMRPWTEGGTIYTPNGAIYLIGAKFLLAGGDWYSGASYGYVMPKERSIDIDTKADLDAARAMLAAVALPPSGPAPLPPPWFGAADSPRE